jgi:hypothetical protein
LCSSIRNPTSGGRSWPPYGAYLECARWPDSVGAVSSASNAAHEPGSGERLSRTEELPDRSL